jgi:hypothetical protein
MIAPAIQQQYATYENTKTVVAQSKPPQFNH